MYGVYISKGGRNWLAGRKGVWYGTGEGGVWYGRENRGERVGWRWSFLINFAIPPEDIGCLK